MAARPPSSDMSVKMERLKVEMKRKLMELEVLYEQASKLHGSREWMSHLDDLRKTVQWEAQELKMLKQTQSGFSDKIQNLQQKILLKRREAEEKSKHFKSLQASFSIQSNQALRHDGHFQDMDDGYSRDKLVTRYRHLYDETDISCQKLEETFLHAQESVERRGAAFFLAVTDECFKLADKLFEKLKRDLKHQCHSLWQDTNTSENGLNFLLKDLIRQHYKGALPQRMVQDVLQEMKESFHDLVPTMCEEDKNTAERILEVFTKKACQIAWPAKLLPNKVELRSPLDVRQRFDPDFYSRHALSGHSQEVKESLWYPLVQDETVCLVKGIAITE